MINKTTTLILTSILLFCNYLCFSQSHSPYIDIIVENSSKYKTFQKNFNPLKYDPTIVNNCLITMLNDLRQQLYGCTPLTRLPLLDSVALMQAEFQGEYDKLTDQNIAPLQYTAQRLKNYGLTAQGDEYVSKGKAHQGDKDYSYYDLCIELLKPLFKTTQGAIPAILSPQYTIYGFGCAINKSMNFVYISVIMGNDLTIQTFNSLGSKQKNLPISKGYAGLRFYDAEVCKKCAADNSLEQIYDMLYWNEDGNVFLESDDAKWAKKLLAKAGKYMVLDFIQKEQYNCRNPQVDHNKPFRGLVSKPILVTKIIDSNDSTVKSNLFHAKIGAIPPQIELTKAIDINLLLLSDKKHVCRTLIKKNVNTIKIADEQINALIQEQNYEKALYQLSPLLSDSTITESQLFTIMQLAAHKEKTYMSSIFTQSVQMALLRNPQRLCNLLNEFSVAVFDNKEVRKIYCNTCH